jgi:glycosyltransferase involved in cell wall biosynthesis
VATLLSFPLSHKGGVSTFVAGLLQAQSNCLDADLVLVSPDRFRGGPGKPTAQIVLGIQQLLHLVRLRPTIVHVHEHPVLLGAAIAYRMLFRPMTRVVYTIHVDPIERRRWWKRRVLGWLAARCWAVTAVSRHTVEHLENVAWPIPTNVCVIPGGAGIRVREADDPQVVAFRAAHRIGSGPVLTQISPFNFPGKVRGIVQLVAAFKLVRARFPGAQLILAGDGDLRPIVEDALRRAETTDAVVLTGFLDDVSLPLALADVYCHVSFHDACPLSLLEAMRSRRPIVAVTEGGIPELVSDGLDGVLTSANPQAIARAVIALLEDPATAARLGARAAQTASARFTWERVARDFAEVYRLAPG